jgi:hypothetical protein
MPAPGEITITPRIVEAPSRGGVEGYGVRSGVGPAGGGGATPPFAAFRLGCWRDAGGGCFGAAATASACRAGALATDIYLGSACARGGPNAEATSWRRGG